MGHQSHRFPEPTIPSTNSHPRTRNQPAPADTKPANGTPRPNGAVLHDTSADLHTIERIARAAAYPQTQQIMIRGLLDRPSGYSALSIAVTRDDLRAAALAAVRTLIEREIDAGRPWTGEAARWLSRAHANWQTSAALANHLTWYARSRRNSALAHLTGTNHLTQPGTDRTHAQALRHIHLAGLRFDFRCRSIQQLLNQASGSERAHWDPYTRALAAFALLGSSARGALDAMDRSLAEAGDNPQVCHALLHGLWLGDGLPDQAERILELAAWPTFDDGDPIMLFRTATAWRMLGRRAEALTAIDSALEALGPNQPEVHADFVRERALITALARESQHDQEH
ncbi:MULTISPECIES: hypothetical protein [unclassified Kitasatospora]|uniref:hypothetical protein n=1 Tax=unclassified Kitasatospora TaxID=2633591 RepID=UPI0033DBDC48